MAIVDEPGAACIGLILLGHERLLPEIEAVHKKRACRPRERQAERSRGGVRLREAPPRKTEAKSSRSKEAMGACGG
ncbi:hypothetical protein B0G75_112131 [Paraburkholderia sp. BL18I3N2]|nr:hypothetical protein B0G75_112131 [Paraburkholderia sp. BL18I3N2]